MTDRLLEGLPVVDLFPGSVAERAGVRVGDRVLIANGLPIESLSSYIDARRIYTDRLELTLQRGNQILERLLVFEKPDMPRKPTALA